MVESFEEIRRNAEVTINAGKINLSDDAYDNSFVSNAHFVYELLQNADDAKASEITFELFRDKLVVTHNGERKFNLDDVDSITSIKQSTKKSDNDTIGKFGIGFKSVFKYTNKPEIQSGDFAFNITHIILPTIIPKKVDLGDNTEVTIPFNRGNPNESYLEIKEKLSQLSEDSIMFIERISRINIIYDEINIIISKSVDNVKKISEQISSNIVTISSSDENKKYYCFTFSGLELNDGDKIITNQEVKIAYLLNDDGNIIKDEGHPFFVYFPTNIGTGLPYLVHAPFQTLEGRSLLQICKLNNALYRKIGELVFESIVELKNREMLNTDFYDKFIIIDGNYSSQYIVISIKNYLTKSIENGSEILPVLPNGYSSIDKIMIYDYIKNSNINEFNLVEKTFSPKEISDYAINYSGRKFWGSNYSAKLRNFMMGIDRNVSIEFDKILKLFNSKWLETKSIDDIKRIYMIIAPLNKNGELGDIVYPLNNYYTSYSKKAELRSYPLIRDTQNHHISVDSGNVYLNNNSINQMLLEDSYCHSFITEILDVKEYSKKDKSIDDAKLILSKYDDNESAKKITASENIDDLKKLRDYIGENYIKEDEVKNHRIIYADRCDNEISCWHTPDDIYLTVKMGGDEFTEMLLSGINSAYFLSEEYYEKYNNDDSITLIKTYITPNLEPIPRRRCDSYIKNYTDNMFKNGCEATNDIEEQLHGYINRTIYVKPTENTSPDFNPFLEIPHLEDILNNITFERSIILFRYLSRYVSRIYDEIKYNSSKSFSENSKLRGVQKIYSEMGYLLSNRSWLYDKNNLICFCSPNSVDISELNEKYSEISKGLLSKLGVRGIVSEEFKEIISNLSPDDKKMVEKMESMIKKYSRKQLDEMEDDFDKKIAKNNKSINKDGLNPTQAFLNHNIKDSGNAKNYNSDKLYPRVKHPQKYSENIGKEIDEHLTNESRRKIKTQSIIVDDNKPEKEFLKSEYSGKCQICGKEIIKLDETPFFVVHKLDKDLNPEYINSRNVGWDSICVCPNCDAELKNCPNNISSAILNAFKNSTNKNFESGMKISFDFWGEKREIKLTQRHILSIIAAFKLFDEKDKLQNEEP